MQTADEFGKAQISSTSIGCVMKGQKIAMLRFNNQESRCKPGQSSRGVSRRKKYFSNVPAHASLFVKKLDFKLKSFFTVAGIEECSNCEYGVGPSGS